MSVSEQVKTVSFVAGAAFVAADFGKLVEISAANTVTIVNATTDIPIGAIAEVPVAIGQEVPVAMIGGGGRGLLQAGGNITAGQLLVPANDGQVTAVASLAAIPVDSMAVGVALMNAADGDIFEAAIMPIAAPHTA